MANLMKCDSCRNRNVMCFLCNNSEYYKKSNWSYAEYIKRKAYEELTQKIVKRLEECEGTYVDVDIVIGIIKEEGGMNV